MHITSEVKVTHQNKAFPLECWQYTGQSFGQWPDWLQSKFPFTPKPRPVKGTWALRDDEGYFYRWMDTETFAIRYEALPEPMKSECDGCEPTPLKGTIVSGKQIDLSHGGHVFVAERDGVYFFRFRNAEGTDTQFKLSVEASLALLQLMRPGATALERWIAIASENGSWRVSPEPATES